MKLKSPDITKLNSMQAILRAEFTFTESMTADDFVALKKVCSYEINVKL